MTKKEAIENHRKMWNWIADETERQKRVVKKQEYFDFLCRAIEIYRNDPPVCLCFCCEYDFQEVLLNNLIHSSKRCTHCPISFGADHRRKNCTSNPESPYAKWKECDLSDWQDAAKYAREIAELPERSA